MKKILLSSIFLGFFSIVVAQTSLNGKIDDFSELSTSYTVPFSMPDGVKLMTDIYLPVTRDCLTVPVDFNGMSFDVMLIKRGTQLIRYDSVNHQPNPNPFQLPMVFSRTPYNKGDGRNAEGSLVALLGYAYAVQDMRGRYTSEGVYLPLMSDSWNKNPYHTFQHNLDVMPPSSPSNGNKHEDGYNSIKYITDSLRWDFDLNYDGVPDFNDFLVNGRIGMFGASALGYNQYQAAAAHPIDDTRPGLKCLTPIVAPGEFYKSTGYHNGVFRDRLVTGWLKGQIFTGTDDDRIPEDEADASTNGYFHAVQNNIHSSFDYNLPNKFVAANKAIDHFVEIQYEDAAGHKSYAGYYPSSIGRSDMDISRAMVDNNGEGALNGTKSRYSNMEVPAYHLTGWWDIFIDGQIETWAFMRKNLDKSKQNYKLQKLVIGPWAHQTIGQRTTGDMTYPENIIDLIGINFDEFNLDNIPLGKALRSEIIAWFRYNLNYQDGAYLGEPTCVIPKNLTPQPVVVGGLPLGTITVPAEDIKLTFNELLGVLNGSQGIDSVKIIVNAPILNINDSVIYYDYTPSGTPLVPALGTDSIVSIPYRNFSNDYDVPNVRFYVPGPNGDGVAENAHVGNYWFASDTFPLQEPYVEFKDVFMHPNGELDLPSAPQTPTNIEDEYNIYVHDPDDPLRTCGGGNMIERTPDGNRDSQGQMDFNSDENRAACLSRPGIIGYTSAPIQDSLCVIGFPNATIYAKSNPGGAAEGDSTDTDFFVRILDVYPDGRELFVVEGAVNARARDYARNLLDHPEMDLEFPYPNDKTPFTNIETGKIYEYRFKMFPIAYTWGKGHRMKVLISSSNFDRFQVNPNIPIQAGEFFRRKPGDGQTYTFNGVEYAPRVAVQRLAFSSEHPTHISLPVYNQQYVGMEESYTNHQTELNALVYPNPTSGDFSIFMNHRSSYSISIFDIMGKLIFENKMEGEKLDLSLANAGSGLYFISIQDSKTGEKWVEKMEIKN
ncbi:MAG: CocE/NonD family hydrolase [Bacteroidia bacterium]|nr:CocE/NonD family hydrolase [Bacteroidia bacterium]